VIAPNGELPRNALILSTGARPPPSATKATNPLACPAVGRYLLAAESLGGQAMPEALARRMATYPKEAMRFFDGGFASAASLSDDVRRQVLNHVIQNLKDGGRQVRGSLLAPVTNLSERESEQLASAYSLVIGLLVDSSATPEEFIEAGRGRLFTEQYEGIAKSIATAICAIRDEIKPILERAQLAGQVLPSLTGFDVALDVRVRVLDRTVANYVPIVVVHIGTDATSDDLWLQLSRSDIDDLITKLSDCLVQMDAAESFFSKAS
jgi:hypothetical protein